MLTSNLFIGMLISDMAEVSLYPSRQLPKSIPLTGASVELSWYWRRSEYAATSTRTSSEVSDIFGYTFMKFGFVTHCCVGSPSRRHICQSRVTSSSAASVFLPGLQSGNLVRSELGSSFPSVRWLRAPLVFPWAAIGFGFSCRQLEDQDCVGLSPTLEAYSLLLTKWECSIFDTSRAPEDG